MTLSFTWVGDENAPRLGFVTHGVLGAGHNLRSFVRRITDQRADFRFALVDLRLHGKNATHAAPHTLEACVDDFLKLEEQIGKPDVFIGHSLGGKVGICYAARVTDDWARRGRKPVQVWALDSDPGAQDPGETHQVKQVLRIAQSVQVPAQTREDVVRALVQAGLSSGLSNWLTTNLERTNSGYNWRLDFRAISDLAADYFSRDLWPFLADRAQSEAGPAIHLVVAENSDRWSGNMKERARLLPARGRFELHELPKAGHWVHVDNPEGLTQILLNHLPAPT